MAARTSTYWTEGSNLMNQKEIAKAAKISTSYMSQIILRQRVVSLPTAEALEQATMVSREAWAWPERHYNPYIPLVRPGTCRCCGKVERVINRRADR